MSDENIVERVCLLAIYKKQSNENLKDVQKMLVDTGMFEMKECKAVFKMLKKENYISEDGELTMNGIMEAQLAQKMFAQ